MRDQLGTDTRSTRQNHFTWEPSADRPRTAQELQLAADMLMAVGNRQRAEILSWRAHDARAEVTA